MTTTRTFYIAGKKVIIKDVPDEVTDEQLIKMKLTEIYEGMKTNSQTNYYAS